MSMQEVKLVPVVSVRKSSIHHQQEAESNQNHITTKLDPPIFEEKL
jgi:hypothetical protein